MYSCFFKLQKQLYECLFHVIPKPIENGFLTVSECLPINQDHHNPEQSTLGLAASLKLLNFIFYLCGKLTSHDQ